jgi:hypothetical protein
MTDIVVCSATLLPFRETSQVEVPARLVNVLCNLFAQCLHRGKPDLIPQALEEKDLHLGISLQFEGMKIQQVGLDSK